MTLTAQIAKARKELRDAKNKFAGRLDEWLIEMIDDALHSKKALVQLFEEYYDSSLYHLRITEIDFTAGE